jgi:hypothetical protein
MTPLLAGALRQGDFFPYGVRCATLSRGHYGELPVSIPGLGLLRQCHDSVCLCLVAGLDNEFCALT